jgi:hypothetical protein
VERERRKGREGIHPSLHLSLEIPNGIPYAGWWRVRERKTKGGKLPFWKENTENFLDLQSILIEPSENLNTGPSDLFLSVISGSSEWQGTLSFESTILLRAPLFHP